MAGLISFFEKGDLKGNWQLLWDVDWLIPFEKIRNSQSQKANGFG